MYFYLSKNDIPVNRLRLLSEMLITSWHSLDKTDLSFEDRSSNFNFQTSVENGPAQETNLKRYLESC